MPHTGLIIDGARVPVPGRVVTNYLDDPRITLALPEDGRAKRTARVQLVVLHTTKGIPGGKDRRPQVIHPGVGPNLEAEVKVTRFWSTSDLQSGAHVVMDQDGSGGCLADLVKVTAYHAKAMNARSVGIEIYQGSDAGLYAEQLEATADVVDAITLALGIQRQIPDRYRGPLPRLQSGGADVVGVVGHRDGDDNRGEGDPGNEIFAVLDRRGYARVNMAAAEDLALWRARQRSFNKARATVQPLAVDGIPGPATVAALKALGYAGGIWTPGEP